jgi:hypothetical protein
MKTKKKLKSTLIFIIFLAGSYIVFYHLGRWIAIGVILQVLSFYLLARLDIKSYAEKKDKEYQDHDKKER